MNETVKKALEQIKIECSPDKDKSRFAEFGEIFDMFFGQTPKKRPNFIGGINDKRNTLHENLFHAMYPYLKSQVHFGTGKGGFEKYMAKRFTADFYDEEKNIIYEIDGTSHNTKIQSLKDKIRDYFFYHELGIMTYRFTNEQVERMVIERLDHLYEEGVLHERNTN